MELLPYLIAGFLRDEEFSKRLKVFKERVRALPSPSAVLYVDEEREGMVGLLLVRGEDGSSIAVDVGELRPDGSFSTIPAAVVDALRELGVPLEKRSVSHEEFIRVSAEVRGEGCPHPSNVGGREEREGKVELKAPTLKEILDLVAA